MGGRAVTSPRDTPRAVWLLPYYPWEGDPVSGTFFQNQVRALAAASADVTVVAPTPWVPPLFSRLRSRWRRYAAAPASQVADGVPVVRPRYPTLPRDSTIAAPDRLIANAAWRVRRRWLPADLIHGHFALQALAAAVLARRTGLPYVVTMHGSDVNSWPEAHPEWRVALVSALEGAARVIAVSGALADRIAQLADVQAVVLPIGLDHAEFRRAAGSDRSRLREQAGIAQDAMVALFVGNLLRSKGIAEFVEGIDRAGPQVVGVVIGEGPERRHLESGGSALSRLRWLGRLPNDAVAQWMAAADALVLPSSAEGLPTVIVEAGSVGLPVIASRVGGIPELLDDDRGIVLRDISGRAVAEALALVADPGVRSAMIDRLRRHVELSYDSHLNAARLIDVYRSAMIDGGASRT